MAVNICNHRTHEQKTRGPKAQGHLRLYSKPVEGQIWSYEGLITLPTPTST